MPKLTWDNIDDYHLTNKGYLRKGKYSYILREGDNVCKYCSSVYVTDIKNIKQGKGLYCSYSCFDYNDNPMKGSDQSKDKNPMWKGGNTISLYDTYAKQLEPYDVKCRRLSNDKKVLQVQCMYCGKWYIPTRNECHHKVQCIKGNYKGELNLYCSNECKQACSTYSQRKYPKGFKVNTSREVQPHLRKLVLKRDNYTCQKCGCDDKQLHCHHITGVEINPVESADIDNCITLCIDCHKEVHKQPECNMRKKEC